MATLTDKTIASTYKDLLQVSNSNSGVDATLRPIEDGEGTASALNVSSGAVATFSSKPYLQYSTASETDYEVLALDKVDGGNGRIRVYQSGSGSNRGFEIQTGGSATLTCTSGGVVELNKGQLSFPDTQNASSDGNTLDDYEEGTFSPTIKGYSTANSSKAMTMSSNTTGTYTKIGRLVTCTIFAETTDYGTVDSNLHIALYGLPFTINNTAGGYASRSGLAGVNPYGLAITAGHTIGGFGIGNATKVYLTEHNSTLGYIALLRDKWSVDGSIECSFSYIVA